jgi:hypothetical protein
MHNDGKGKQVMGPPSTPASAYKVNGGPSLGPLHKPAGSPDKYIEPLSNDEHIPAVPAPEITGLSAGEKAALVYQQLLAHGERQKVQTGKYRSIADDVRAQAELERVAQKEGEDVEMSGQ